MSHEGFRRVEFDDVQGRRYNIPLHLIDDVHLNPANETFGVVVYTVRAGDDMTFTKTVHVISEVVDRLTMEMGWLRGVSDE